MDAWRVPGRQRRGGSVGTGARHSAGPSRSPAASARGGASSVGRAEGAAAGSAGERPGAALPSAEGVKAMEAAPPLAASPGAASS